MINEIQQMKKKKIQNYAMKSAGKILNSTRKADEMSETDLNDVLNSQIQPFIELHEDLEILDLMEKMIEEQEVNVSYDTTDFDKSLESFAKKYLT